MYSGLPNHQLQRVVAQLNRLRAEEKCDRARKRRKPSSGAVDEGGEDAVADEEGRPGETAKVTHAGLLDSKRMHEHDGLPDSISIACALCMLDMYVYGYAPALVA